MKKVHKQQLTSSSIRNNKRKSSHRWFLGKPPMIPLVCEGWNFSFGKILLEKGVNQVVSRFLPNQNLIKQIIGKIAMQNAFSVCRTLMWPELCFFRLRPLFFAAELGVQIGV